MPDTCLIPLELSPARLDDFCRQLRQRTPDPALALQLLTTLQAFIGVCAVDPSAPGYQRARGELDKHLEELRAALLDHHAARIGMALRLCDTDALARSFTALSRSGFADAATRAGAVLADADRTAVLHWLSGWLEDARRRADAASRYPDAPDFRAAGVALETYLALKELHGILQPHDSASG